jgi:hypothetical protein
MGYAGAPRLEDIDASRKLGESIRRHSHIALRDDEYTNALDGLRAAGAEEEGFYRP